MFGPSCNLDSAVGSQCAHTRECSALIPSQRCLKGQAIRFSLNLIDKWHTSRERRSQSHGSWAAASPTWLGYRR